MRITNPELLWAYFVLIPVFIFFIIFYISGISDLKKLTGTWRFVVIKRVYTVRYIILSFLFLLVLISQLIALSGMSWQKRPEKDDSVDLEVIFLLDISNSMLALDIIPSRLDKSVSLISTVINSVENSKYGIIVFKGEAVVSVPITEDRLALDSFLTTVSPHLITSPGSNQEKAIRLGLNSFTGNSIHKRVLVLVSDGEALEGDILKIVSDSINEEIPIYTVAAGTSKGGTIPIGKDNLKNRQGKTNAL